MSRRSPARLLWPFAVAGALASACASGPFGFGPRPAWELPPPPPKEAPVVRDGALHRVQLDNGLTLMVLEDHRTPLAALGVAFPRGAAIVPPDQAGLADFTTELMKRGAGDRDALQLAQAVDDLGASLSVSSDWDVTSVVVSGLSRDLDVLSSILADVVLRPRFDPAEAERARSEQLAELAQAEDEPGTLVSWYALRELYPGHRYGLPASGTPESVARLDAAEARRFHDQVVRTGGAVVFASGDVRIDDIQRLVEDTLGPDVWPASEAVPVSPPPPARTPESTRVLVVDKPDLVQSRIVIAHEGIERTHPDRIAIDLVNKVLGSSGFSSRLFTRVRSDEGLTYSIASGYDLRRHAGPFLISTFTRASETGRVVQLVLDEMERIREQPPSEKELSQVTSLAVGRFGLGLESSEAVLASLVDLQLYELPPDSLDTYRTRVREVDAAKAAEVAREFVHPDRVAIVVLGPAEIVVPQLERFGPVEVVEP